MEENVTSLGECRSKTMAVIATTMRTTTAAATVSETAAATTATTTVAASTTTVAATTTLATTTTVMTASATTTTTTAATIATSRMDTLSVCDIEKNQISEAEMKSNPVFKNYERGEPNVKLYVKNLAKQVGRPGLQPRSSVDP